jgi:NTE family protein
MAQPSPRPLNIAIQGGGSHGAFAWGILDTLLADGGFEIASITATSAGAMNAVVAAYGLMTGGPEGARTTLEGFWRRISESRAPFFPVSMNTIRSLWDPFNLMGERVHRWFDALTTVASPYEFNPWNFNPLRDALTETVDFEALRKGCPIRLFLSTTDVRTGKVRVFRTEEITADVVLAAACLPYLFQAVEIDGAAYWDGGYVANPALFPIFYEDLPNDILICHINPMIRDGVPKTSAEIMDRLNEISFNASLIAELRAIAFVQKLVKKDQLKDELRSRYRAINVHSIRADGPLGGMGVATKLRTDWPFLTDLKARGQASARAWLAACSECVGVRSSVDLAAEYL